MMKNKGSIKNRNVALRNFNFALIITLIFLSLFTAMDIHAITAFPEKPKQSLKWSKNGVIISLKDELNLPEISWPLTLLEYPVDFSTEPVIAKDLVLVDHGKNQSVPFQLSEIQLNNGKINRALLCFMSDLPPGAKKEFRLVFRKSQANLKEQVLLNRVSVATTGQERLIDNGLLKVSIPAPGEYQKLIPPVLKIGNENQWLGYSKIPQGLQILKLKVNELSAGQLFAQYQFDYQFKEGKNFQIKIRLVAGMDFLETEESMTGFTSKDSLSWEIVWNEFRPEFRYCPNRPGGPIDPSKKQGYSNFVWEPVSGNVGDPKGLKHPDLPDDQQNLPNGQLPFKIVPYHHYKTLWRGHIAAFWEEKAGQTVGLFIKDFEKWVDPDYPIWGNKDNLSIHFFYQDGFYWSLPLVEGKRSLALAIYSHSKDVALVNRTNLPQLHIDYLRRWHGGISLDKTKDWLLDYGTEKSAHPGFFKSNISDQGTKDILKTLKNAVGQLSIATESTDYGQFSPVHNRRFYDVFTPLFENEESKLSPEDYRHARALYLFMAYILMDEDYMPVRNMLSGHPNFLADCKGIPGMAAFLFPDHPEAKVMADHFEKSIALNFRYHIRPYELAWEAKGGRWTENPGCYTWAALSPTLKTSFLLHHYYDGRNRILQPNISLYADWLLNGLTSPLDIEGGKRVNPPQGAHSKGISPPYLMNMLGRELQYFDPILSEHILWLTSPNDLEFEPKAGHTDPWEEPVKRTFANNQGSNPHLKSAKYTGYGFNLRKNFGAPDEMYVHLQQIDEGPNYRWGRAAKGGNGIIYYYADGKRYSHNGTEDVGDMPFGDTERCTNFGVKKEKSYRCIGDYRSVGRNDLTDPLYDFDFAQFASVQANTEAAPEYKSRSVLMSGNDYILVFDDVKDNSTEGRFSWTVEENDNFPFIHQLKPEAKARDANLKPVTTYKGTTNLKGLYYDGKGDFLTFVTHKEQIKPVSDSGVYRIGKPDGSVEWVTRDDHNLDFNRDGMAFIGTAGIIRQSADKKTFEAALFQGKKIGIPGISAQFTDFHDYAGMSLKNTPNGFSGIIQVRKAATVQFLLKTAAKGLVFYLNGKEITLKKLAENSYSIQVSAGKHEWQWTSAGVIPALTEVQRSVSGPNWCKLEWSPVAGATSYSIQKSLNGGTEWSEAANEIITTNYTLTGLTDCEKVHVRILAKGKGGVGEPSVDYPIYPETAKPHSPEGLSAICESNKVSLNWGQILGADQYVLYQREKGSLKFKKVFSGTGCKTSLSLDNPSVIYEFAVTSANGNGESDKSVMADSVRHGGSLEGTSICGSWKFSVGIFIG